MIKEWYPPVKSRPPLLEPFESQRVEIAPGGQVSFRVVVSTGPEPAPNFVGSSLGEAERFARQRKVALNVGPGQRNPRVPEGIVVRQDPAAGGGGGDGCGAGEAGREDRQISEARVEGEAADGIVEHAMRVTVRRTRREFVPPATHYASPHQDPDYPRMGERLRLRRDFDISGFSPPVQAILRGLKKYGMFVADNGIEWAAIPHFYYDFYVYQYSTGIIAATALAEAGIACNMVAALHHDHAFVPAAQAEAAAAALDIEGVYEAIRSAGLELPECAAAEDLDFILWDLVQNAYIQESATLAEEVQDRLADEGPLPPHEAAALADASQNEGPGAGAFDWHAGARAYRAGMSLEALGD